MQVSFASEDLAMVCNSEKECARRWGDQHAKIIKRRLSELASADSLLIMATIRAAHLHQLVDDRSGQLSVNAKDGMRIVFDVVDDPRPLKPDGGLDWHRVTAIRIVWIGNYHRG